MSFAFEWPIGRLVVTLFVRGETMHVPVSFLLDDRCFGIHHAWSRVEVIDRLNLVHHVQMLHRFGILWVLLCLTLTVS